MKKSEKPLQAEGKKKFRTLYDTQGYDDSTHTGDESPTDPSEYIPTETLISRFLRGDVFISATNPTYEHETDYQDVDENERIFKEAEVKEKFQAELSNLGSEGLTKLQNKIIKAHAETEEKKRSLKQPPKAAAEGAAKAEPKAGEPPREDKPKPERREA